MHSFHDLLLKYPSTPGSIPSGNDRVHASMTAYPGRLQSLRLAVESLLKQVDTLNIFLDNFSDIPAFLDHEKIFLTRSQDFGSLGECGKYYWMDDLAGYHFICSDSLIYPENYVETLILKIEEYGWKAVIGAGGYKLLQPFSSFAGSSLRIDETGHLADDTAVPVINDLALAYHSSTIRVSRHFFYQPELSAFWFSVIALEQQVPLVCCRHDAGWLQASGRPAEITEMDVDVIDLKSFLVRSYFMPLLPEKQEANPFNINAYFDRIYVMNLDRRPDRLEKISRTARKFNINMTRFPAVDGSVEPVKSAWEKYAHSDLMTLPEGIEPLADYRDKFLKYRHYIARIQFVESKLGRKAVQSPGAMGYALSYIGILKEAIQNNYRRILIFDDDIVLHKSFNEEFESHARNLPDDWKLIMLGAMQHRWEPYITHNTGLFYHCHGSSVASHAVGIDRKIFIQLLFYAEKLDLPIDEGAVFHFQNVYDRQCYIFLPNLAIQEMSESDIGSSVMRNEDIGIWTGKFRWNMNDYDLSSSENNYTAQSI